MHLINNLGTYYFDKGLVDEAILHFRHTIKIAPDYADAHYNLGVAYGAKGNYEMAFKEMRVAKSLSAGGQWKKIVKCINRKKPKIKGHQ